MKNKIRVADYIANWLANKKINNIFTITGGGAMYLNDALGKHRELKCYYNHHEQACAMAAEGHYRVNNEMAAVCVTTGPGGTNTITGIIGGYYDSIPMFIISGQVRYDFTTMSYQNNLRQLGDQECNIVKLVESITKYSYFVSNPLEIKYHLEKAYHLATVNRPGPVLLDIPIDVQRAMIDVDDLLEYEIPNDKVKLNPDSVNKALEMIKNANKPLIITGGGIRVGKSEKLFLKFVEDFNIPVITGFNSHDLIANSHPLYIGRQGTLGDRAGNFAVQNCDLLIALGTRLSTRQVSFNPQNFASKAKIIMVDIDDEELNKPTLNISLKIHADIKDFLETIIKNPYKFNGLNWIKYGQMLKQKFDVVLPEYYQEKKLNPYVFTRELSKLLQPDNITVVSNGSALVIGFQAYMIESNQRLFGNSGCASMGYGLPAAIGACIANENETLICLEGDGSIQMNIQELMTVSTNKLNIKIFIYNNGGYHSIRQTQKSFFGEPLVGVGVDSYDLEFPDFKYIAKAYNLPYKEISSIKDLEKIPEILKSKGPTLINVIVNENQTFSPKLSAKQLSDGTLISPSLEDMYPFLDSNELKKYFFED